MVRRGLHSHPPGDFTHRRKQRQPPVRGLHRLVGDRVDAPVEEKLGELPVGGQVQVGEQLLARPEPVVLFRDGLLDLDDQVRGAEYPGRGAGNAGAGCDVLVVGKPAAGSGAGLHHDVVAMVGQLGDTVGLHRDPAFLVLDLFRHTDHQSGHVALLSPARKQLRARQARRLRSLVTDDITQAAPPLSAADPQHRIARQPDATHGWASCQLGFGWSLGTADHVRRRRGAGRLLRAAHRRPGTPF